MAVVEKSINKSGETVYKVSVTNGRGRRVKRTWRPEPGWSARTTQRELQKFAAELENSLAAGELLTKQERDAKKKAAALEAAKMKTLAQYVSGVYMPTKELSFSENSRTNYWQFLNSHILPALGEYCIADITPAMIQKFLVSFQRKGYAIATCVKCHNILGGIFQMAFLDDTISMNPMLKVSRPKPTSADKAAAANQQQAYTVEELRYIFQCLEHESLKWRCYVHLLADTGLRKGEACALRWADVDLSTGMVTVKGNLQYTAAKGVYLTVPKNGKVRCVDIGPDVTGLLKELKQAQAQTCMSEFVFTQDSSPLPMNPQSPTRYFKNFGKRYNIPDFHPHKMRHTAASVAITFGADIASVSARLGHSDVSTTLRLYTHANEESIRRAGQVARDAIKEAK
ncbi:MAG: site-specific integrase [Clostridiales bacterium]|nr:site-specific integrase [Clostridiales bacterium]